MVSKKTQDVEKLQTALNELEHLDIDNERDAHEKLQNWSEHNNATAPNKEKGTLESALQRANKSLLKVTKDIAELEDAVCYTCGQALHEDKKAEIAERKQKELEDAQSYSDEISR